MLSEGDTSMLALWREVLAGTRHPLTHGYFCTRQPNDAERDQGIAPELARKRELEFFANTLPWSSFDGARLGTAKLVETLSRLLTSLTQNA
jgi:hypothetical protein